MVQCAVSYRMATGMITGTAELNCICLRGVSMKIGNQQDTGILEKCFDIKGLI